MSQTISVVITDLDNTLFDWLDIWYKPFRAMLTALAQDSGIPEETLLTEFKRIHEKHGTAEYAFSIEELPSLKSKYDREDLPHRFQRAIDAYRAARSEALVLYPNVLETLETLKDTGCLLVGYTESISYYSIYRMRQLNLDRVMDYLYSPPDHDLPPRKRPTSPEEQLRRTKFRPLPKGEKKPNPKVLLDILAGVGATKGETVYVGDSRIKDVLMAQQAGITDVWAKYGEAHLRGEYELLKKVTHWSASEVERERALKPSDISPTYVLKRSFGELLDHFHFKTFVDSTEKHVAHTVDIWKTTVTVQRHFNDLELKIRSYAVTVIAGFLGLAAYSVKERLELTLFGRSIAFAAVILLAGILPWLAFYFMDRCWYHRLLYGAIAHGKLIEDRLTTVHPEIHLTDTIGQHSPFRLFGFGPRIHTPLKIDIFYLSIALLLILLAIVAQLTAHGRAAAPISSIIEGVGCFCSL